MYSRMSLAAELMLSSSAEGGAPSAAPFYSLLRAEDAPAPARGGPPSAHWSLESIAWDPVALRAESVTHTGGAEELTAASPTPRGRAALLPVPLPPRAPHGAAVASALSGGSGGSGRSGGSGAPLRHRLTCVALGCAAPLQQSGSSARSRLCAAHLRAPSFVAAPGGIGRRWCQKCNRAHDLSAYSGPQRTCVAALAVAAARRRQRTAERAAARRAHDAATSAVEDSAGSDSPLGSAAHAAPRRSLAGADEDEFEAALARAFGAFDGTPGVMEPAATEDAFCGFDPVTASLLFTSDAAVPQMQPVQPRGGGAWSAYAQVASLGGGVSAPAPLPYQPPALAGFGYAPAALHALASYGYAPHAPAPAPGWWLLPARAHVKLPGAAMPQGLPPGLAPAAAAALFMAQPMALTGCVAPGCTLMTLEALVPADGADPARERGAKAALAALLAAPGDVGVYFRAQEAVHVAAGGRVATARRGRLDADAPAREPARMPRLHALAARCDAPATVSAAAGVARMPAAAALRCRVHGRFLRLADCGEGSGVDLAAAGEEGVALLELAPPADDDADGGFTPPGAPRPLLLTRHDDIVAELNAAHSAAGNDDDADGMEADVTLLGHALRPDAPRALLAAAAAAAMRRGWAAAAARCCAVLAPPSEYAAKSNECDDGMLATLPTTPAELGWWHGGSGEAMVDDDVAAPRRLLHEAVVAGCGAGLAAALAAGGADRSLGAACAAAGWHGGATPLRLAAAMALGAPAAASAAACVAAKTLTLGATDAAAADACIAWLSARDAAGRTPADVVASAGAEAPAAMCALDSELRAAVDEARPIAQRAVLRASAAHRDLAWPQAALAAAAALQAAAVPADDDTAMLKPAVSRRAAIAAALLRSAAADWRPAADAAVARREREAVWRVLQYSPGLELMAAFQCAYHVAQWYRSAPASVPLAALGARAIDAVARPVPGASPGVFAVRAFEDLGPLYPFCFRTNLWFQAPVTLLMVALLAGGPRGRAALAAHLQPLLALQFIAHALACMLAQTWAFHALAMAPAGVDELHLPARCAAFAAAFTLLCAVCWPMRPAVALPLLAVRAACPALAAVSAARFGRVWPPMGGSTGAALQVAAAAAAAVHCVLRERRLRADFARYEAAVAAVPRGKKATKQD
jgi:hypothetical protein